MATVSRTSLDNVPGAVAQRRSKAEPAVVLGGLALCAVYFVLPERFVFLRELLIGVGVELGVVVAILLAVRIYRPATALPWLLLAAGIFLWTVGDLIWGVYEVRGDAPFPSLADGFYLVGYPVLAAGLMVIVRKRFPNGDRGALVDAAIVATSAGFLAWVFVIEPYRETWQTDAEFGLLDLLISSAYPIGDLLLLSVAARFLIADVWRMAAFRRLGGALVLTLLADTLVLLTDLGDITVGDRYTNTIFLLAIVLYGAAAVHPSMRLLTQAVDEPPPAPGWKRLSLIGLAALVPLAVLIVQIARDDALYLPATITATVVLIALAMTRFLGLATDSQKAFRREATLNRYSAGLLGAQGREEIFALSSRAAGELLAGRRVAVLDPQRPEAGIGGPAVSLEAGGEIVAKLVSDAPRAELARARDSLESVAKELAMALERERLLASERHAAETLAEQNERLRELDQLKDQFVSSVSHELRTPLTSMVGYLEILLDGEAGELDEQQRHFLEIINRNCTRLNKLIDDILFVARVDAGRLSLDPHSVERRRAGRSCGRIGAGRRRAQGGRLRLSAPGRPPAALGGPDAPHPAARQPALERDQVHARTAARSRSASSATTTSLRIEVADTGVGIPADEVGRLFERFFRASTGATIQGTGLGLLDRQVDRRGPRRHRSPSRASSASAPPSRSSCRCPACPMRPPIPQPTEVTT